MCSFCEEARRRMVRLATLMDAWTRSRTGVSRETAAAIDNLYREQYRNAAREDHLDANNHSRQT